MLTEYVYFIILSFYIQVETLYTLSLVWIRERCCVVYNLLNCLSLVFPPFPSNTVLWTRSLYTFIILQMLGLSTVWPSHVRTDVLRHLCHDVIKGAGLIMWLAGSAVKDLPHVKICDFFGVPFLTQYSGKSLNFFFLTRGDKPCQLKF